MKKLLVLAFVLLSLSISAQHYIETSISMEDKAIGINYINLSKGFALGAESGLYKHSNYEIEHQRYKIGFAQLFYAPYSWQSDIIVNLSFCYNDYHVLFKDEAIGKLKKYSIDLGVRPSITDNIFIGLNYDLVLKHGGFSIGFLIN